MLDRDRIKRELKGRGMTLGAWARARGVDYAALSRVLHGFGGKSISHEILAYLAQDGLLFEEAEGVSGETMKAVFWSFSDASKYLGISEGRLRRWAREGVSGFPRPIYIGNGSSLMLNREAVQDWCQKIICKSEAGRAADNKKGR